MNYSKAIQLALKADLIYVPGWMGDEVTHAESPYIEGTDILPFLKTFVKMLSEEIYNEVLEQLEDSYETASVHATSRDCKMFNAGIDKCVRIVQQMKEEL